MTQIIMGVAGGLAIFLYGMTTCSEALQKASGPALRGVIHRLTSNPLMAVIVGAIVTVLIQSSSATTVILVGLVGASLMTLKQSIGVILGADVGTTLTVQLIAFNITAYSLGMVAVGFLIRFIAKTNRHRNIGQIILGFGFIFYGMGLMSAAMEPLREYPGAEELFISFGTNPLLGLLVATVFTALIQASAATLGIALSLSMQGLIPLESAIPLILGANIGTCATAMLSTIGAPIEARRVGVAHVLFKILGVLFILPFIVPFTNLVMMTASSTTRQIANAHTMFNVGITVVFLPFAAKFSQLIERIVPDRKSEKDIAKPVYLDKRSIGTPIIALEQARREVIRVASIIEEMVTKVGNLLENNHETIYTEIEKLEDAVDNLYREIMTFCSDVSQQKLSSQESEHNLLWLQTINDLEHIGDVLLRMSQIISNKVTNKNIFSSEGFQELHDLHEQVSMLISAMVATLDSRDEENVKSLLKNADAIIKWEDDLRISHIRRLQAYISVSRDSSSIHLDLINSMRKIAEHVLLIGRNCYNISNPNLYDDHLLEKLEAESQTASSSSQEDTSA